MRWFGRALAWSISLVLITVGLLWPVIFGALPQAAGPASDPVVITNFRGDFVVDRDGRLEATETITTRFPSGRHGIFRYWDVANQNDSHIRQVPQVTEILLDDQPVPYKMLWQNQQRFLVAKIGDPDRYLDFGTHVFRIRYTIDGSVPSPTNGTLYSGPLSISRTTLDWGIPDEATAWLARDFMPTGESLECDFDKIRNALAALFAEDAEFASVRFGAELLPRELQLVLTSQEAADEGPEYLIQGVGRYFRVERDPDMQCPVDPEEHAMLDVCAATFAELAAQYKSKIIEPPPPRYRSSSARKRGGSN